METKREYITLEQAQGYAIERNISDLPSHNHTISTVLSRAEELATGIATRNLGQDNRGYFISTNISYLRK